MPYRRPALVNEPPLVQMPDGKMRRRLTINCRLLRLLLFHRGALAERLAAQTALLWEDSLGEAWEFRPFEVHITETDLDNIVKALPGMDRKNPAVQALARAVGVVGDDEESLRAWVGLRIQGAYRAPQVRRERVRAAR
jgi:hypothetical protein